MDAALPQRRESDRVRVRADKEGTKRTPIIVQHTLVVLALAILATVLTLVAGDITRHVRFAFFTVATVIAAIFTGLPGGLFMIVVGTLVVGYEWLPPHGSMSLTDPASVFAVLTFTVGGLIVTALSARFRQQTRELAEARDRAIAAEERRHLIAEAGRVLSSSLDYETTVATVARLAVPTFADSCAVDLLVHGQIERLAVAHDDPAKLRLLKQIELRIRPALTDDAGIAAVIRTGEPQFMPLVTDALLVSVARNAEHLDQLRKLGIHSAMIVPMTTRGMVLGALTLISARPERRFTEADFNTAQALGRRAAVAIDNARLYRAARAANEVKSNFIATMSHELRTPLTAIMGFQELLADGVVAPVAEEQKQPLERIKISAMRLSSLIEEILLFARLDAGTESLAAESFQVKHVVDDVIAFSSAAAGECKLALRADPVDPELDIHTDYGKVRQILISLISNALKFTPDGEVVVRARAANDSIELEVEDTGIGIDETQLAHIFDPFWQVDQTRTRRSGGSGLGLSVARRLAHLLGGDISVSSTPSEGSTFRVRLPRAAPRVA